MSDRHVLLLSLETTQVLVVLKAQHILPRWGARSSHPKAEVDRRSCELPSAVILLELPRLISHPATYLTRRRTLPSFSPPSSPLPPPSPSLSPLGDESLTAKSSSSCAQTSPAAMGNIVGFSDTQFVGTQ